MPEIAVQGLTLVMRLLEICGAAFLVVGFIVATVHWIQPMSSGEKRQALSSYRQSLGRTVLIGLEVLVAATIIKTIIVEPSLEGLGLLAAMVVIRTILGWSTVLEINGRWPWQRAHTPQ